MKCLHQNCILKICHFPLFTCISSPHVLLSLWLLHPPSNSVASFSVKCFMYLMPPCLYLCFMLPGWLFTFFWKKTSILSRLSSYLKSSLLSQRGKVRTFLLSHTAPSTLIACGHLLSLKVSSLREGRASHSSFKAISNNRTWNIAGVRKSSDVQWNQKDLTGENLKKGLLTAVSRVNELTGMMQPWKHEGQRRLLPLCVWRVRRLRMLLLELEPEPKKGRLSGQRPNSTACWSSISNFLPIICTKLNLYPLHEQISLCLSFNQEKAAQSCVKTYVGHCS